MPQYYDIHCHVFNKNVVTRSLVGIVQSLLNLADEENAGDSNHKIESLIVNLENLMQPESEDVFQVLNEAYDESFVVTPLMLDLTYADDNDGDNKRKDRRYRRRINNIFFAIAEVLPLATRKLPPESREIARKLRERIKEFVKDFEVRTDEEVEIFDDANYTQQIVELEALAAKFKTVRPFFCVDPRREHKDGENIIKLLEEKILNGPFVGVKLYAPVGFSPTDPVLMGKGPKKGVYQFCIEHNVPITVHCSNSGFACLSTHLNVNGHIHLNDQIFAAPVAPHKFHYKFIGRKAGEAIHERASVLNHPKLWALVLEKYPTLTINFAHLGGSGPLMEFVQYTINEDVIKKNEFEDSIAHLSEHDRSIIESGYRKKLGKMRLREDLSHDERAKLWNTMYEAGIIENWAKSIFDLVRNPKYVNAYTDLSCFSAGEMVDLPGDGKNEKVFSVAEPLKKFKREVYDNLTDYEKSKILYGSDYFLIRFFGSEMKQYLADFKNAFGQDFDTIASKNPEAFLGIS